MYKIKFITEKYVKEEVLKVREKFVKDLYLPVYTAQPESLKNLSIIILYNETENFNRVVEGYAAETLIKMVTGSDVSRFVKSTYEEVLKSSKTPKEYSEKLAKIQEEKAVEIVYSQNSDCAKDKPKENFVKDLLAIAFDGAKKNDQIKYCQNINNLVDPELLERVQKTCDNRLKKLGKNCVSVHEAQKYIPSKEINDDDIME